MIVSTASARYEMVRPFSVTRFWLWWCNTLSQRYHVSRTASALLAARRVLRLTVDVIAPVSRAACRDIIDIRRLPFADDVIGSTDAQFPMRAI